MRAGRPASRAAEPACASATGVASPSCRRATACCWCRQWRATPATRRLRPTEGRVSYFDTDPPSLIAGRGHPVSLMFRQTSANAARDEGRNESLWEHQGEALVRWGEQAAQRHCRLQLR